MDLLVKESTPRARATLYGSLASSDLPKILIASVAALHNFVMHPVNER